MTVGTSACGPPALNFGIALPAISDYYRFDLIGIFLSDIYHRDPFTEILFLSYLPARLVHANYVPFDVG